MAGDMHYSRGAILFDKQVIVYHNTTTVGEEDVPTANHGIIIEKNFDSSSEDYKQLVVTRKYITINIEPESKKTPTENEEEKKVRRKNELKSCVNKIVKWIEYLTSSHILGGDLSVYISPEWHYRDIHQVNRILEKLARYTDNTALNPGGIVLAAYTGITNYEEGVNWNMLENCYAHIKSAWGSNLHYIRLALGVAEFDQKFCRAWSYPEKALAPARTTPTIGYDLFDAWMEKLKSNRMLGNKIPILFKLGYSGATNEQRNAKYLYRWNSNMILKVKEIFSSNLARDASGFTR